jgi:hypothetical protein
MQRNMQWFKKYFLPALQEYKIAYSSFQNGDLGDLDRVELEGNDIGATIEFWSSGWLGVHIYDYKIDDTVLNALLEPEEDLEKEYIFKKIEILLR